VSRQRPAESGGWADNQAIGTAAIWQRPAGDHGATVAYYTLRTYVVRCRAVKPRDKID
jgi:hypothetical protein